MVRNRCGDIGGRLGGTRPRQAFPLLHLSGRPERPAHRGGVQQRQRKRPRLPRMDRIPAGADAYFLTGVTDRIVRTMPSADDISMVCVWICPFTRLAPSRSSPLVTPVAAKIVSPETRSSRL